MRTIDYTVPCTNEYTIDGYLRYHYNKDKLLFFDIETTGFLAKNTTLYLIGVLWYSDNILYIRQWFNDDGISEKEIILSFLECCRKFTHLVHFNGLGFDLPYLKQKSNILSISFTLERSMSHIDIYKEIRPYKNIFALDNMKQVSIERYLQIKRKDTYNGKELINIYQRYIAKPNLELENVLLLHNHDDLLGMTQVSQILQYKSFFETLVIDSVDACVAEEQLIIKFTWDNRNLLPQRISVSSNEMYLNAIHCNASIHIPLYKGTLKHFFSDYKNYYYLPLEDVAIHKNIATYVEASNKVKASKHTCYVKKTDSYIPYIKMDNIDIFQHEFNDKKAYQTLDSFIESNSESKKYYIKNTLLAFL